jgi:hypothetical protein
MKKLLSLWLVLAVSGVADAHTLASDEGLPVQIGHQFFGLHHLPATAILLLGSIVLIGYIRRTRRRAGKQQ